MRAFSICAQTGISFAERGAQDIQMLKGTTMQSKTAKDFFTLKGMSVLAACALMLTAMTGCADRNKNGQPDDAATSGEINRSLDKAGDAAKNAAGAAENAASSAANSVANATKNLDDAATITPAIKTAFGANAALKGSNINVDTTDQAVTLSGTVKNAAQSKIAEAIAKSKAAGYKIVNNLKVAGGASPMMKKS